MNTPQEVNAFRKGFITALDYARDTGWPDARRAGAMSLLNTILRVALTGEKVSFFDAVRNDPEMSAEDKAYWLAMEPHKESEEK